MTAADPRAVESLLAFWAEAGVDSTVLDAAPDRMQPPVSRAPKPVAVAPPAPALSAEPSASASPAGIAEARRLAAAAPDLAALVAAIAAFDGCGLKFEGASQAVVYRGSPTADVMVIGEAPGADEDRLGQPFVGRAGKLLDRMLGAAGLSERVYITNTVFWRPPGNRTPSPAEQMVCAPFLERQIALVQPKLLLLAGGAAAKSVLGQSAGILSLRGRWFDWVSSDGSLSAPAVATLHPAFLLRQPAAKKKAWSDLLNLMERLDQAKSGL